MVKSALKLTINGTVQGIFFRQFCKENAEKLNLKGYVRNLESGDLELLLEGNKEDIDKMCHIVKGGTPHSQIRTIRAEEKKWSGVFKDFSIMKF